MAKQLNVNLGFTADTSQAKAKIQELQNSLTNIAKMPGKASSLFDDTSIKKASQAALELQSHLQKAVNIDTGKLDLSRFSSSLKASNKDLITYCNTLLATGKQGQQAFLQLAQSIAMADTPVTHINKKFAELGTTLANTARWQFSSSLLHGFMGALQSAYGYAQDLNESLNNIRIVTGKNIDEMATFATQANKAAKALSATTTEYTDASLIYYQQGLDGAAVEERAAVTLKMANVSRQSAEVVSDQMTAVWNNFYDGSKSLEYYADVMTALGAATASSTDEISQGLEKFAAVADTVGLSYEYATAALATVTAETRQSADVVGTAFKTLFARIEGLSLGETLDDGTNLNKYSEALLKVGINVKDQNGQLKDMDNILNEMGSKWSTLAKDQQVALAQTVGGVRQYNQLISLMDNWDKFQQNLGTAQGSTGALQEQADIYAESWEAAQDRVRAAAENIYDSLINDEFFIDILNGFEKILETVGGLIDGLGGLKGVIGIVGSVFLTSFAQKMPETLSNLRQNFMVFSGQSKKAMIEMQSELNIVLAKQQANPTLSDSYKIQLEGISKVNDMKQKLILASKDLTSQERKEYQAKIDNIEAMYKEVAALAEKKKMADSLVSSTKKTADSGAIKSSTKMFNNYANQQNKISILEEKATEPGSSDSSTDIYTKALENARQKAVDLEFQIEEVKKAYELTADEVDVLIGTNDNQELLADTQKKIADKAKETTQTFTDQIKQRANLDDLSTSVQSQAAQWEKVSIAIKKAQSEGVNRNLPKHVDDMKQKMQQYLQVLQKLAKDNGISISEKKIESMSNSIDGMNINNIDMVSKDFTEFAKIVSGEADKAIEGLDVSIEELRDDMKTMQFDDNEIKEMEQAAEGAATANKDLSNSMSNISGMADEDVQGTFKMSVALTEFASTAMSVSSLITSVQSAISVFTDEGASGFEKIGAAIAVLMPLMSTYNSLQTLSITLSKQAKIAKLGEVAGQKAANVMAALGIGIKNTETGAVVANTAAWYANPIMWIALIVIGVIAAFTALVAIIVKVTQVLIDMHNKDKIAAEEASQYADAMQKKYEKLAENANKFKEAVTGYEEAVNSLNTLKEGTEEYSTALEDANKKALELIETYGLWNNFKRDGDLIIIDPNKLSEIDNQLSEDANIAQSNALAAKINNIEKRNSADMRAVSDEIGPLETYKTYTAPVYDENQKIVGQESYNQFNGRWSLTNEDLSSLYKAMGDSGYDFSREGSLEEWLKTSSLELSDVILQNAETLGEFQDIIVEKAKAYNEDTEAIKFHSQELMSSLITNSEIEKQAMLDAANGDANLYEQIVNAKITNYSDKDVKLSTGKTYQEELEIMQSDLDNYGNISNKELKSYLEGLGQTVGEMNDEETARKYAIDILGYTKDEVEQLDYQKDGAGKGKLVDGQGNSIFDDGSLTDNYMRRQIAINAKTTELNKDLDESTQALNNSFNEAMANLADEGVLGQSIIASLQNGIENADFSEVYGAISSAEEQQELIALNADELAKRLGLTEENIKALGYKSAEDFEKAFDEGLLGWSEEAYKEAQQIKADSLLTDAATKYELDEDTLKIQASLIQENNKALEDNAVIAAEAAIANQRLNKGVDALTDDWEDWSKVLKESDKSSQEYAEALKGIQDAMKDILNLSDDAIIPTEFLQSEETLELLDDIANGSEEAVENLGYNLTRAQVDAQELTTEIQERLATTFSGDSVSVEEISARFDEIKNSAISAITEMQIAFDNLSPGESLSGDKALEFATALNRYAEMTGMSVEQMQGMLNQMQVSADVTVAETKIKSSVPQTKTVRQISGQEYDKEGRLTGYTMTDTTSIVDYVEADETIQIAQINTKEPPKITKVGAGTIAASNTVSGKNNSGTNKGNSSSSSTPKESVKKSDTVERYKEINDELEDISRNLDKINDKMDDAYGQARLDAMDEYIATLEEENKALEKKGKEIERNISEDQQTVADAAAGVGMSVKFDKNGNIANATQIENAWYDRLASATTKEEQDEIQGYIDIWEDAQGDYEDSLSEYWDNEEEKRANKRKQQEKQYEKWSYKIEIDAELDESELAIIDYYQEKLSEDIYGMTESVALQGQEIDITLGNLAAREGQYAELTQLYKDGKISQAQYAEGLKELQEAELEDLTTLREKKKELEEYYRNTLAMAAEEIDKYTERLERSTKVLEHYQTLLELTGQGQNYEVIGQVLEGQQRTVENQYEASKVEYEMYKKDYDEKYAAWIAEKDPERKAALKEDLEETEQYMNDAWDRMASNSEKRAEIAAQIFENSLNQIQKRMESVLTNGRSFDEVSMQMEHQQSLQEEYLTTTNKIYETTKMMRNLQNEIDKTTNSVAKQKLKAFQQETKQLQEQGKLSKFELDIQQKKYDLLLAKIALEEAQNAKSTVRLTRDSEGNFGYVYTADQEQISGAQQAVDDAENALYNTQLDGANNYAEKSFQLRQEGLNALAELEEAHRNHQIGSEEEYQRRRQEIVDYYTQQLTDISNLYGVAVSGDSRIAAEAWSSNIEDLVTDASDWKNETQKYISDVDIAWNKMNTELEKIAKDMGVSLDDIEKNVKDVTKESDQLSKKLTKDVIPDMQETIEQVDTLAQKLLKKLTPQIKDATKKGEALAEKMVKVQNKLSGLAGEAEQSANRAAEAAGSWRDYWNAVNNVDSESSTGGNPVGGNSSDKNPPPATKTKSVKITLYDYYYLTGGKRSLTVTDGGYSADSSLRSGISYGFSYGGNSGYITTQDRKKLKDVFGYDTGGYTGEWGTSEGKLAYLHEKEIILNKEDTKNFLASLELLHNIIRMIDINTSNSLISRLDSADLKTNKSNDILEQHVTIEAVFPNVEDRYEIEEAFMNLTNEASQYINRKNN